MAGGGTSGQCRIVVVSPQIFPHIRGRRFVAFFILTGIAGALVHAGLNWGESAILVGASGAVFGLLGAGAFVLIRGQDGFSNPSGKDILQYVLLMMIVNLGMLCSAAAMLAGRLMRVASLQVWSCFRYAPTTAGSKRRFRVVSD